MLRRFVRSEGARSTIDRRRVGVMFAPLIAAIAPLPAIGQLRFQQTVGTDGTEVGYDISRTPDGYITAGFRRATATALRKIMVCRHLEDGTFTAGGWGASPKLVGGTGDDVGYNVIALMDGNYAVAAETTSVGGGMEIGLLRFSAGGVLIGPSWAFTGTAFAAGAIGTDLTQLTNQGVAVVGRYRPGVGMFGTLSMMTPAWAPAFHRLYFDASIGTDGIVSFNDVGQMTDGRIVVCGSVAVAATAPRDALIAWFDLAGNPLSARVFGTTAADEYFDSLHVLSNGDVALIGPDSTIAPGSRFTRVNPVGALLVSRLYKNFVSAQSCIREDGDHERLIIAGSRPKSPAAALNWASLLNTSLAGDDIHAAQYGLGSPDTNEVGQGAMVARDCGYMLVGATNSFGLGGYDQYQVRTLLNLVSGCFEMFDPQPEARDPWPVHDTTLNGTFIQAVQWTPAVVQLGSRKVLCFSKDCPPDFNGDGFLNGDDFDEFNDAFGDGSFLADYNCDGFVNGDDYDDYVADFEAGC